MFSWLGHLRVLPVSNASLLDVLHTVEALIHSVRKVVLVLSRFIDDFVVGFDVSSEFSFVAMLEPSGALIRKPFRIDHNPSGFQKLLEILKNEEERLQRKPIYFVESTGIFHLPLFFFLRSNDLKGFVLNPLSVHSIKNLDIRKVKNDSKDAEKIAKLAKYQNVKFSIIPEPQVLALRMMVREYYSLSDTITEMKNRLSTDLYLLFPGYRKVFSEPYGKASLALLKDFSTPMDILSAERSILIELIAKHGRKGASWASKKVDGLLEYASNAASMPMEFSMLGIKIKICVDNIISLQKNLESIVNKIREIVNSMDFPATVKRQIELIDQLPGIGYISAVTLIAEIGDFRMFKSPKAFVAYFGIDPSVNESGKFKGDQNKISKRGTRIGRRVLFTVALTAISTKSNGEEVNPILRDYYQKKCGSKKKKVALVAVMHKLLHYIFAVLRDDKPFEVRQPEEHQSWRAAKLQLIAA